MSEDDVVECRAVGLTFGTDILEDEISCRFLNQPIKSMISRTGPLLSKNRVVRMTKVVYDLILPTTDMSEGRDFHAITPDFSMIAAVPFGVLTPNI